MESPFVIANRHAFIWIKAKRKGEMLHCYAPQPKELQFSKNLNIFPKGFFFLFCFLCIQVEKNQQMP